MPFVENNDCAKDFLKELIQINSINPPGNELNVAKKIVSHAQEAGLFAEMRLLSENRANVIVRFEEKEMNKTGNHSTLLFSGHLDTVPVGDIPWELSPFSGEEVEGKIYGRGTSDMKGGVAAMIEAMIQLKKEGIKLGGDFIFIGTVGEEVDCLGAKEIVKEDFFENVGAIVIGEPSNGKVFTAHKGALWLQIETFGKTAHCSMPNEGINAVLHMNEIINRIEKYKYELKGKHRLLGESSLVISTIQGGVTTNVVPDKCTITIDIRTIPGIDHATIINDINHILQSLKSEFPDFNANLKVTNNLKSIECEENDSFVKLALKINEEQTLSSQENMGVNYYTDGSIFSLNSNAPIVIYGPGDEKLAHQPNEYVETKKYFKAIQFYIELTKQYFVEIEKNNRVSIYS
jgi:succinyl-diaminopimelate desuccinylase